MTWIKQGSIAAFALAASLLLAHVHPFGNAGLFAAGATQPPIPDHGAIPPSVRAILTTKCADCHSSQVRTPFYGHFAPMSWLIERDIMEARQSMNLSQWDTYTADEQQALAAKIVQETRSGDMPLPQYRMIHWNARITSADLQTLSGWAHGTPAPADSAAQPTSAGDPVHGAALFEKRCTGCHSLTTSREGPLLKGVYGRTTGAVPSFPYSNALKNAHLAWNDQSLDKWLADPDAFLPGNNMDFLVTRPQERKDLIAYLRQSAAQ
ncbi:MAG TPA: heme-binding domain-containing protein [Acidobacteriaceae bacterium]|jgi:cytochrome c